MHPKHHRILRWPQHRNPELLGSYLRLNLVELAGRASTLEERLRHARANGPVGLEDPGRRERWLAVLGGESGLERRLAMSGWPEDRPLSEGDLAPPLLGEAELPSWARCLERMLEALGPEPSPEFREPNRPLPFEELHLAWAGLFLGELEGEPGLRRLHSRARHSIVRYLANLLCEQSTPVLVKEFRLYLAQRDPLCAFDPEAAAGGREHYQAFVADLRRRRLSEILHAYPVLARRLAEEYERQLRAVTEFLRRLEADAEQLAEFFELDCSQLTDLKFGIGDRHHDGRSVTYLQFGDGRSLIYKPRSLAKEAALGQLAEEVTAPLEYPLKGLRILLRPGYGWMEFAQHAACADQAAAERCYQRLGMLLALVHALRGDDCHAENLVVAGEFPYLIDAESFAQGSAHPRPADSGTSLYHELEDSVLTTGFLPIWVPLETPGQAYDAGGFTGRGGCEMPVFNLTWKHINSDGMIPARTPRLSPHGGNAVFLDGQRTEISDYLPQFLRGFAQVYRRLLEQRPALEDLLHSPARFIPRPTRIYHNLLLNSHQPEFLRDGLDLSFHLEQLVSTYLQNWTTLPDWFWQVEIEQLARLDVPYVCLDSRECTLKGAASPLLARSGEQITLLQLESLSEESLARQLDILGLVWRDIRTAPATPLSRAKTPGPPERFLRSALKISEWFQREALADPDGLGFRWRTVVPAPQETRLLPGQTLSDLYAGSLGIAIFLGASARAGGGGGEMALELLLCTEKLLLQEPEKVSTSLFSGTAGWVYAAHRLADFLDRPDLLERARHLAGLGQAGEEQWDVGAGWAGRILALANLSGWDLQSEVNRLSAAQAPHGGWGEEKALGGFAHGSAGAAVALLRGGAWEGAARAWDYQRTLATQVRGLWHDHRPDGTPGLAWCQGSAGVGLAALEAYRWGRPELSQDLLEDALHAILERPVSPEGTMCCGGMGGLDLLLEAGAVLGRGHLTSEARWRATAWLDLQEQGSWPILRGSGQRVCVGLFQGLAGLGYGMLRLHSPQDYSSVLRFL